MQHEAERSDEAPSGERSLSGEQTVDAPGVRESGRAPVDEQRRRDFEDVLARVTESLPDDAMIGAVVGDRYRVVSRLARGGMGRIYAAEHLTLGTRVAIKTLRVDQASLDSVERFRREARAAARLRSPHIAQVHDFGELPDGSLYLVMEMLVGEDLGRRLSRERRIAPRAAISILRQIASALDAAHAQGFVHRDLKPENVFLVADVVYEELVKVLDFGIAKRVLASTGTLTEAGAVIGTPGFMPPEQALAGLGARVTPASDVYSLGAMALEMLTGELPYAGSRAIDVLKAMHEGAPRLPSQLGFEVPGLDAVFARALAREPDARYASASELVAALGEVIAPDDREDVGLRRLSSRPPPAPPPRASTPRLEADTLPGQRVSEPAVPAEAVPAKAVHAKDAAPSRAAQEGSVEVEAQDAAAPRAGRGAWVAVALAFAFAAGAAMGWIAAG